MMKRASTRMPKAPSALVDEGPAAKPQGHGGAREGAGRPRLQQGADTVVVSTKMTEAQRDKLQRLGGAPWIRERIDRAREPTD